MKVTSLFKPRKWVAHLLRKRISTRFSDKTYLILKYYAFMGKKLNLKTPQTFNEKLQWLKLYDRKPEYTKMVDKYAAKEYVAGVIGEEYIIPTLGVWEKFDDIDFASLPDKFVLKCTHDSGGLVICRDKSEFDMEAARAKIERAMKKNYFYSGREWPYKDVPKRILAEKYMENGNDGELVDYKFYCFNGEPKFLYVSKGLEKHETARISFLTLDWKFAPYQRSDYRAFEELPPKPKDFDKMIALAGKLSAKHFFLRVDLYQIGSQVFFSELTFTPASGLMPLKEKEHDIEIGEMLKLP